MDSISECVNSISKSIEKMQVEKISLIDTEVLLFLTSLYYNLYPYWLDKIGIDGTTLYIFLRDVNGKLYHHKFNISICSEYSNRVKLFIRKELGINVI